MIDFVINFKLAGGFLVAGLFLWSINNCLNQGPKLYRPPKTFKYDPSSDVPYHKQFSDAMFGSMEQVLASSTLEEMAGFVDSACYHSESDREFCRTQANLGLEKLSRSPDERDYDQWNSTSLGNMAYLILYGHRDYREDFRTIFQDYLTHTNTKLKFPLYKND